MKCIDSRKRNGLTWRRYRNDAGEEVRTVEIPAGLWPALQRSGRARDRVAQNQRAELRAELRRRAQAMMDRGWKPEALSMELGVPTRTLHRWRSE